MQRSDPLGETQAFDAMRDALRRAVTGESPTSASRQRLTKRARKAAKRNTGRQ
jgi:hypothetical protein